jgi:hypothetical protein
MCFYIKKNNDMGAVCETLGYPSVFPQNRKRGRSNYRM